MPFPEIQSDPDICSNCFRRTHDRYERNYRLEVVQRENEEGKLEWTVEPVNVQGIELTMPDGSTEKIGGMEDDVYKIPKATIKIPEKGALNGLRTICACGYRYMPYEERPEKEHCSCEEEDCDCRKDWKRRPLDKATFFEYAERIAERMREKGVDFCEESFFDKLDRLKSDPDNQFADDRMFEQACEYASAIESVRESEGEHSVEAD